jgi:hypothetical protein
MKHYLLLSATLLLSCICFAQDKTVQGLKTESEKKVKHEVADTTDRPWKVGGLFGINLSQGTLSNWAAGGDAFSLSVNSIANVFAIYKKGKESWDNNLDINIGYIQTTSLGGRKNDDRFDFLSRYGHAISHNWDLGLLFNFRTQLFRGYTYTDTSSLFSSKFMSPAYIVISPGFNYKPKDHFSAFLSPVTSRFVIVSNNELAAKGLYGVEPGKHVSYEFGAFATLDYNTSLSRQVSYRGRLDLFSNYKHNPQNVDVYFTNLVAFKISSTLSATYNLDIIYDDDTKLFGKDHNSPAMQLKSLIGIGVLKKF